MHGEIRVTKMMQFDISTLFQHLMLVFFFHDDLYVNVDHYAFKLIAYLQYK